jgi:hypothetical protein
VHAAQLIRHSLFSQILTLKYALGFFLKKP